MRHAIRCYDNGGKTIDRYTVIYMEYPENWSPGCFDARGMSATPTSPDGFGCYTSAKPGRHLGKRIKFEQLPIQCQLLVLEDLE